MKDRLQQFLNAEQLSPARLSDIIGIQRSGLSHILSGRNKPSFDFIQKLLLKFPSINSEWLITGKGKMYKDQNNPTPQITIFPDRNLQDEFTPKIADRLSVTEEKQVSEPSENLMDHLEQDNAVKKRRLIKMILAYSDGTFMDFKPEENLYDKD